MAYPSTASALSLDRIARDFAIDPILERYSREQGLSLDVAKEHERELKRYLVMCVLNPTVNYGMKGPIDELWHVFLIFTKEYAAFCQSLGRQFIHHVPATLGDETSADYTAFLNDYEVVFGEQPPVHLWPRPTAGQGADTSDCSFGNCGPSCSPSCGASGCSAS